MTELLIAEPGQKLERVADDVYVREMIYVTDAIDLWLGDLTRRGYSQRTRFTYTRILDKFCGSLPPKLDVAKVTPDDCRRFLDTVNRKSPATRAQHHSVVTQFFKWLWREEKIKRSPMERIVRPKVPAPEDRDVTTVSSADVSRLFGAASGWPERLTIGVLAYLGPRRHAAAQLRLRDYDRDSKRLRFREKGGKVIWKPIPDQLVSLLEEAIAAGIYESGSGEAEVAGEARESAAAKPRDSRGTTREVTPRIHPDPDAYLIPGRSRQRRDGDRDDRIIWKTVKTVADRCGVECHAHALRAAFAVFYLEQNPGDLEALKELMGHSRIDTTQVYLRRLDRGVAMERVRSLEWA